MPSETTKTHEKLMNREDLYFEAISPHFQRISFDSKYFEIPPKKAKKLRARVHKQTGGAVIIDLRYLPYGMIDIISSAALDRDETYLAAAEDTAIAFILKHSILKSYIDGEG